MDKIQKFLARLPKKERILVRETVTLLVSGKTKDLDIKKLKGFENVFRVRVHSIRIIYRKLESGIQIIEMGRRDDQTYKNI